MLKVERPMSKEWVDEVVTFFTMHLPPERKVHPAYLGPMLGSSMMHLFVSREGEAAGGTITGLELWLTMPNPVNGGARILKHLCSCGTLPGEIKMYREAVFASFSEGISDEGI